ncbi:MAG: hypothetical protein M3Z03_08495 [Actinomycetota bacterium]|nr:hypothetical protein [Actinomycetota bacterium]
MAAPERRRRARTLVVALSVALAAVGILGTVPAQARPNQTGGQCSPFPFCSSIPVSSTSAPDDVTTTTEDDDVTTTTEDDDRGTTETTRERTPTTEERVTTTVFQVSTSVDLLVPGDGTEGAESTTTTEAEQLGTGGGGLSDNQLVLLIVSGLSVMGAAVGLLTWRYWKATQPVEVPLEPITREQAQRPASRTQRSVFLDP